MEYIPKERAISEESMINLDKMVFKFVDESSIQKLLDEQKLKNIKKDDVVKVAEYISRKYDEIKIEVQDRLSVYIPDFNAPEFEVLFSVIRGADFRCPNDNKIEVDVARLTTDPNIHDTLVNGITHEVFHNWANNKFISGARPESIEVVNEDKIDFLWNVMDEGLAVNISGQNLEEFYNLRLGKKYDIESAFNSFNKLLKLTDKNEAEMLTDQGQRSMGFMYVVGYEISRAIENGLGVSALRTILSDLDLLMFFEKYFEICQSNNSLPKIDFEAVTKIIRRNKI